MSSLADELVLLRLHEARSNASTEFKNQDGQAAASGLAARRRAVREAQFVIGSYGARAGEDGRVASAKGSTAWDHAEPIRLSCGEEGLKVRYEARQRDLRQRERIEGIRARMEGKGACVRGVSLADGAGQSAVLREVQGMRQGSLVLRLVPDVKRSIDYGDERAGAGVGTGAGGADVQRQQWAPPPKRGGFERPGTVQPAPATRSNHPVANANRNASDRNVRNGHPSGNSKAGGGFGSARSEYIQTMKKQGKKPTFEGQAGRQAGFGHSNTDANNATANGKAVSMDIESQTRHLPPYMRKALASMNSLGNNNGNTNNTNNNKNTNNTNNANNTNNTAGQKKKTGASDDKAEGPMSQRTYELLGLDPFTMASEGRFVLMLPEAQAQEALKLLRRWQSGAAIIGRIGGEGLLLETSLGVRRPLELGRGELLPRICCWPGGPGGWDDGVCSLEQSCTPTGPP